MKTKLLATTALAIALGFASAAGAQDANNRVFDRQNPATYEAQGGYYAATPGQVLASRLIGQGVYNGVAENAERVGDVNDIVMGQDGNARAIIIGVGGFLGIGEKDVAVDFDQVTYQAAANGERWLTIAATKEQLEGAPQFDRAALERRMEGEQAATQPAQTTTTTAAPAADANTTTTTQPVTTTTAQPAQTTEQTANQQTAQTTQQATDPNAQPAQPAQPMDMSKMQPVEMTAVTAENLTGARVYGPNNEDIGEVADIVMGDANSIRGFVVDVGGFLGMGERRVMIEPSQVKFMSDGGDDIVVMAPMTKEQLEGMPEYKE